MYTKLYESLSKATREDTPWEYFTIGQVLTQQQIQEIKRADIDRADVLHDGTRSGYKDGVAKQNDKFLARLGQSHCELCFYRCPA